MIMHFLLKEVCDEGFALHQGTCIFIIGAAQGMCTSVHTGLIHPTVTSTQSFENCGLRVTKRQRSLTLAQH